MLPEAEGGKPQAIIIATGSEVGLAMEAQKLLAAKGKNVRVVSMPSTDVFDAQDAAYREGVLPKGVKRVAVEAGVTGAGTNMSGSTARWWVWIASVNPPRPARCSSTSASPPTTSPRRSKKFCKILTAKAPRTPRKAILNLKNLGALGVLAVQI